MSDWQFELNRQNSPGKPNSIFGTIFLILFATPFAGFGLFALIGGIRKVAAGNFKEGAGLCVFGLIFAAVGFGLMAGAILARKKAAQRAELEARFRDKPWLLRPDWAAGKIKSTSLAQSVLFLIMALAFGGLGGAMTFVALPGELHKHNYAALLILLFPLVGIGFLIALISALLSKLRYGTCFLELAQIPIPLGGTLEGMIQTGGRLKLEHGLHLKFSCLRRTVSGSGKNRSTREEVLWQDEKVLKPDAGLPESEPGHSGIPVYFKLPDGQPQCFSSGDTSVLWRLDARAKMAGPDFSASFEVPVFQVAGAGPGPADEPDPTAAMQMPIEELRRDEHSKITVSDGPGGREFYFPAARNPGAALFTSVLALGFDSAAGMTFYFHAPILFPIFLSLFGLIISCFAFSLWLKSSRVTVDSSSVRIVTRYLFFGRTREFRAGDIVRFDTSAGMTSGTQVFLDLRLILRTENDDVAAEQARFQQTGQRPPLRLRTGNSPGFLVASAIPSAWEAKWLAREMNRALGRVASGIPA